MLITGIHKNTYQDRIIACPHIQIDGSDADSDHNVDYKPQPVIPEVP